MTAVIIIVVVAALIMLFLPRYQAMGELRASQRAADEADEMLTKAESALLLREDARAEHLFNSAFYKAEHTDALLASQALDGLARVRTRRGDYAGAVPLLEQALALKDKWPVSKPNYELLLARNLEEARSKSASS